MKNKYQKVLDAWTNVSVLKLGDNYGFDKN